MDGTSWIQKQHGEGKVEKKITDKFQELMASIKFYILLGKLRMRWINHLESPHSDRFV